MTTEREDKEANRLAEKLYPTLSHIDKGKRLKSLAEMNKGSKVKLSKIRRPNVYNNFGGERRKKKRHTLLYLCILVIVLLVGFGVAVEISCHINGDPAPWREWQVRYEFSPWTDAGSNQNCRFNTREHWIDNASNWMLSVPMHLDYVWQSVQERFESLREGQQIDEKVINEVETLIAWIEGLSLNQRVVVGLFSAAMLGLLFLVVPVLRSSRRWIRRKRIPKKICLHLDRDT